MIGSLVFGMCLAVMLMAAVLLMTYVIGTLVCAIILAVMYVLARIETRAQATRERNRVIAETLDELEADPDPLARKLAELERNATKH
jgi:predicted membrane protein